MKRLWKAIKYFGRKVSANRMGAYSAQTAFFMFLSLIPLVMLLLTMLSKFGTTSEEIISNVQNVAPSFLLRFLNIYLDEIIDVGSISVTIVSAVVLLWSASRGVFAIIGGLNSVYEVKEKRNFFVLRLLAILYTVAFIAMMLIALLLMVFGNAIGEYVYSVMTDLKGLVYIISSLRFIIGFVMLVLFFMLVYKTLPGAKVRFAEQIPGAVISSAGWVAFSILFSFYIDNFSNYSNIYGSLTIIIVLLLWLYGCMYIMFIGAEVNFILSSKLREIKQ
ncbi:MAG: YihY/virulence factor BrkB family protein [Clostridia bacterium]|nr:YihY/virulence factor BrkB family protein [Clostridia bacterium]